MKYAFRFPFILMGLLCPLTATAITIVTEPVGNPGNASDPTTGYGAVDHYYDIGKYKVTVGQYTEFLNAVARYYDPHQLYSSWIADDFKVARIVRSGGQFSVIGSPNSPMTYVSWLDTVRFANWLHNGQPGLNGPPVPQDSASTEDGSYDLTGSDNPNFIVRKPGATWVIPTENEWYKAAYYQPSDRGGDSDNYWAYPTRSNDQPNSDQPPGDATINTNVGNFVFDDGLTNGYNDGYAVTGSADFDNNQNYMTDVGAYSSSHSFYNTFDQGGGTWEWNETPNLVFPGEKGMRGGAYNNDPYNSNALARNSTDPFARGAIIGFRVALIPEPTTLTLAALGIVAGLMTRRRKNA